MDTNDKTSSRILDVSRNHLDERGVAKRLQVVLPGWVFRAVTVTYNAMLSVVPFSVKYRIGLLLRRGKHPYKVVRPGDVVVQVGAPRDILRAGRSRAIYFAMLVGEAGKVVVVEPDSKNCAALQHFLERHGLSSRVSLHEVGAWQETSQLEFLSSARHPAANVLACATDVSQQDQRERHYVKVTIPVDTLDNIVAASGNSSVRLLSITPNAGEAAIIDGAASVLKRCSPFISSSATRRSFVEHMAKFGYANTAADDRGYFFAKSG